MYLFLGCIINIIYTALAHCKYIQYIMLFMSAHSHVYKHCHSNYCIPDTLAIGKHLNPNCMFYEWHVDLFQFIHTICIVQMKIGYLDSSSYVMYKYVMSPSAHFLSVEIRSVCTYVTTRTTVYIYYCEALISRVKIFAKSCFSKILLQ